MSSVYVRDTFKAFIVAQAATESLVDLSAHFESVEDLLAQQTPPLGPKVPWLGIEFLPSDEVPIAIATGNTQGKYRESGIIQLHVVGIAKLGVADSILTRGETLRALLRGRNISGIRIESVSPVNFALGATLDFEAGFMSGTILVSYEHDKDL